MKIRRLFVLPLIVLGSPSLQSQSIAEAKTWYAANEFAKAKVVFERELRQNVRNAEAHYYLGMIAMRSERNYDRAVELLEKATELSPSNARYHFDLGRAYGARAQTSNFAVQMITAPKVKSAFEKAVELDGRMVEARQGLLQYYLIAPGIMGGSVSKAREQAEELVKLDAFQGNLAMAAIAEKNDDVTSMEIYCSKAAAANLKSNQPYNRLGYFYLGKGRHDDAIAQFKKMVQAQPEDANSYDSLGDGYMAKNMIDDAIDSYKKSLERDPKFSPSIYNLAQCFEKKNLHDDAKRMYEQYLQVAPDGRHAKAVRNKLSK